MTFFAQWLVFIFFCYLLHIFQDVEASRQLMVTLISLAEANHEIQFIMAFRPRNVEVTWIECGYTYKYSFIKLRSSRIASVVELAKDAYAPLIF